MKKQIVTVFLFSIILSACSKKENLEKDSFNVLQYQTEFVEKIISPSIDHFLEKSTILNDAIITFSVSKTEINLTSLKNAWKNTAIAFAKTEMGNLGAVKNSAVYTSINSWEANELAIEDFIASTSLISEDSINNSPTKTRGLSAIEYLLFDKNITETVALFANQRRTDFLIYLGKNMLDKATYLDKQWKEYSNSFIDNSSFGLNGSINMVVNQMNVLLENVRRFKIGEPAGLEDSSTLNSNLLQADKSKISLKLIEQNIAVLKEIYLGNTYGLDHYVRLVSNSDDVNNAINTQFSKIESNIASLSNASLKSAIDNNNVMVKKLYDNLRDLIILIKVDVASILSITVTFTDNDGD